MKILYISTISDTVNAFLTPHIKMLINEGHKVDVAFNIKQDLKPEIFDMGCKVHEVQFQRSPFSIKNIWAFKILKKIIVFEKYDLIHTHTPVASAISRLICRNIHSVKIFYTAHGFHFYKGAPIKNWLIYYPIEKWLSKYTDTLITINHEDYKIAKYKFHTREIVYIPGVGVNVNKFMNVIVDKSAKRKELGIPEDAFVVLSVGELNKNKNHEVIIKAIKIIDNPKVHYIICGEGKLEDTLKHSCKDLGIEKQIHMLGFRKDIIEICKSSDVFAFPSKREGLSVSLMEAMACGLPVVCSNIRGNNDLVEDGSNGYLVLENKPDEYMKSIDRLMKDDELRMNMAKRNIFKINNYDVNSVLEKLKKTYSNVVGG